MPRSTSMSSVPCGPVKTPIRPPPCGPTATLHSSSDAVFVDRTPLCLLVPARLLGRCRLLPGVVQVGVGAYHVDAQRDPGTGDVARSPETDAAVSARASMVIG